MFIVFRPDPIGDPLRLQHVFLAHYYLGVLVLAIRSKDFARDGLAIFFGVTARLGFHLNQHALFIGRRVFGLNAHRRRKNQNCNRSYSHRRPPRKGLLLRPDRKMIAPCARISSLGARNPPFGRPFPAHPIRDAHAWKNIGSLGVVNLETSGVTLKPMQRSLSVEKPIRFCLPYLRKRESAN